jgi:2-dehydropantoate 2-reductase
MRICIFGAGAVGGHLAAKLASAGHAVSAVARGANLAALKAGGIALREGERTYTGRLRASGDAAELGAQDVVFVTTKANALSAVADAAPALGHAQTLFVVFVQNGIPWWYAQGIDAGAGAARPRPPDLALLAAAGLHSPALEQLAAITGRLAARKGLYSSA